MGYVILAPAEELLAFNDCWEEEIQVINDNDLNNVTTHQSTLIPKPAEQHKLDLIRREAWKGSRLKAGLEAMRGLNFQNTSHEIIKEFLKTIIKA